MRSEEGESVKEAALMLFRMLQPTFPFVIRLLLVQLDKQVPGGSAPAFKSVVLLLLVEAVLISWLCVVGVVDRACISHICS